MKLSAPFAVIIALCACAASNASATIWYVVPDGSGDATTIQNGITLAQYGDTVVVAAGTYFENVVLPGKGVYLLSESGPSLTVIDGSSSGPVVHFTRNQDLTDVVDGFTIQNGMDMTANRGGVSCDGSYDPILNNPIIRNNIIQYNNCDGGGIACSYGVSPCIEGNIIRYNTAQYWGGAIKVNNDAFPVIKHNLFYGNMAWDHGQAIRLWGCDDGTVVIEGNTFLYHTYAGGPWSGGVIEVDQDSIALIKNNLIAHNVEGIVFSFNGTGTITCNNVWDNGIDYVNCSAGSGDISADPLFCDEANEVLTLAADSPCLPENNSCGELMGAYGMGCSSSFSVSSLSTSAFLVLALGLMGVGLITLRSPA